MKLSKSFQVIVVLVATFILCTFIYLYGPKYKTSENGMKVSYWYVLNPNFETIKIGTYKIYYSNGNLMMTTHYKWGLKNGRQTQYHENGVIWLTSNYIDDLLSGESISYNKSGDINFIAEYKGERKNGDHFLYRDGRLYSQSHYVNGQLSGEKVTFDDTSDTLTIREYRHGRIVVKSKLELLSEAYIDTVKTTLFIGFRDYRSYKGRGQFSGFDEISSMGNHTTLVKPNEDYDYYGFMAHTIEYSLFKDQLSSVELLFDESIFTRLQDSLKYVYGKPTIVTSDMTYWSGNYRGLAILDRDSSNARLRHYMGSEMRNTLHLDRAQNQRFITDLRVEWNRKLRNTGYTGTKNHIVSWLEREKPESLIRYQFEECDKYIMSFYFSTNDTIETHLPKSYNGSPFWGTGLMKPIIYFYPEVETEIEVRLSFNGSLTYTYPQYGDNGWRVIAYPDGRLADPNTMKEYYSLFWEGDFYEDVEIDSGFVVASDTVEAFLESKLSILGFNYKEAQEFIIFWAPILRKSEYNLIKFSTDDYIRDVELNIIPKPDTEIRVLMLFKSVEFQYEIDEQQLEPVRRNGFTIVEWGGSNLDKR